MAISSAVAGAAITKDELLARARALKSEGSSDATNPYKRDINDLNEVFLHNLETRKEATLGEMKAALDSQGAAARKTAGKAFAGGIALAGAGWVLPGLLGIALPGPLKIGMLVGGFYLLTSVSGKAARAAAAAESFSRRLDDFGRSMSYEPRRAAKDPEKAA